MLRLKANKTSLYNLVATYKPLPGMRRVDFQKANGRPDYWLEWTTDDGHTKAFLSSSLGHPILTITSRPARGAWVEIGSSLPLCPWRRSRPARGAWIEIYLLVNDPISILVAPHKGRVG